MATDPNLAADIADMERLLSTATRPKVRAILSDYLQQLRAEQLTRNPTAKPATGTPKPPQPAAAAAPKSAAAAPAPAPAPTPKPAAPTKPPASMPMPAPSSSSSSSNILYVPISSFGWDQDSYGKEPNFVYVYVMSGVDGVGAVKDSVTCDFTETSFDLKILGLDGKNLRLRKDNLDKKINVGESKIIVKKNKVTIKMKKVKGEYGYDSWTNLTAKHKKLTEGGKEKDPGASLMDMMKDLYDEGDDNMCAASCRDHAALAPPRRAPPLAALRLLCHPL